MSRSPAPGPRLGSAATVIFTPWTPSTRTWCKDPYELTAPICEPSHTEGTSTSNAGNVRDIAAVEARSFAELATTATLRLAYRQFKKNRVLQAGLRMISKLKNMSRLNLIPLDRLVRILRHSIVFVLIRMGALSFAVGLPRETEEAGVLKNTFKAARRWTKHEPPEVMACQRIRFGRVKKIK